jgi:1-acyl-sn-glycerol-3-phosphate acyltransferase
MLPPEESEDGGQTVELALTDPPPGLPSAVGDDLRTFLPGLEPDRQLTDWGRSERVEGLVDATIYEFLYHYWFRVEVEGIENVPASGGALLIANHAGAVPSDAVMIAKAIRERRPHPRVVHLTIERFLRGLPGLGMLATKIGGVTAHPANLHRLLFDEQELVLAFPEGRSGPDKPLKERYRLRRFERTGLVEAAFRARVPIVPIAVLGAEEAQPVLARMRLLRRLTRLPRLPIAPPVPLPAKLRIRFLEPVQPNAAEREDSSAQTLVEDIRALIQENLLEMVAARRSVWLG